MTEEQRTFLAHLAPAALASERRTGIPASITLAQAALESAGIGEDGHWHWGQSALAREASNFFGIKYSPFCASHGAYGSVTMPTHEVVKGQSVPVHAEFCAFRTVQDSIDCRAALLMQMPNYALAHQVAQEPASPGKAERFIEALQRARLPYSTNPRYVDEVMAIVREHQLDRTEVLEALAAPEDAPGSAQAVQA
ncbi:MAG TPA: glucosaminidase domain-containing protein [Terriglobia bacterium]|nr:glucosaminidase domain-containing protein [Terriglobia bacterium]